MEVGDGPNFSEVSGYIAGLGVEWAVLRPTWFMENFSEQQYLPSIRDEDRILTATGEGRVPFVSAEDIADVAYRALVDERSHDTDHLILGPELFCYDEVCYSLLVSLVLDCSNGANASHRSRKSSPKLWEGRLHI